MGRALKNVSDETLMDIDVIKVDEIQRNEWCKSAGFYAFVARLTVSVKTMYNKVPWNFYVAIDLMNWE